MRMMGDEMRWLVSNHIGSPERCIKACSRARLDGNTWRCPKFDMGVEHVTIETFGGVRCRLFKRKPETEGDK